MKAGRRKKKRWGESRPLPKEKRKGVARGRDMESRSETISFWGLGFFPLLMWKGGGLNVCARYVPPWQQNLFLFFFFSGVATVLGFFVVLFSFLFSFLSGFQPKLLVRKTTCTFFCLVPSHAFLFLPAFIFFVVVCVPFLSLQSECGLCVRWCFLLSFDWLCLPFPFVFLPERVTSSDIQSLCSETKRRFTNEDYIDAS